MPAPEPLFRSIAAVQFTDNEIRQLARNASKEADSIIKSLEGKEGVSARVRSAQLAMAKMNAELWGGIADATKIGIGDAVWNATEMQALFDEQLMSAAGVSSQYWRQSMIAQAQQGVDSLIARKENGISLSDKVYKNQALSKGMVDKTINNGLLLGKSAKEIAADVSKFINPDVPGGVSYAAMRLGRSEVLNAFHTTSVRNYQNTPWVVIVKWNLSGSHPRPDECNEYAETQHFTGGRVGEFRPMEVPAKPHPNCLCYVTPVQPSLDDFAKRYKAGEYDSYINEQMGCYRVA